MEIKRMQKVPSSLSILGFLFSLSVAQQVETTILLPDSLGGVYCPRAVGYSTRSNRFFISGFERTLIINSQTLERIGFVTPALGFRKLSTKRAMAYNSVNDRLYNKFWANDTVYVVDCETGQRVSAIPGCDSNVGMCVNPTDNKLYIPGTDRVVIIDCSADTILTRLDMSASCLVWDSVHDVLYAACGTTSPRVYVIDGKSNLVIDSVFIGNRPQQIAISFISHKLYVPCNERPYPDKILVIDTDTRQVIDSLAFPWGIIGECAAWNSASNKLYVMGEIPDDQWGVWIYDCAADTFLTTILLSFDGKYIIAGPGANKVYAGDRRGFDVIDGATNQLVRTISLQSSALAWHPGINALGVAGAICDYFAVITDSIIASIDIGAAPSDVVWNPVTNKVYVANGNWHHKVTVIDGAANRVLRNVDLDIDDLDDLCLNTRHNKIYVEKRSFGITILDGQADTIIKTVDFRTSEMQMLYNPIDDRLFLVDATDFPTLQEMWVLDGKNDSVLHRWYAGAHTCLHLNPCEDEVYLTCYYLDSLGITHRGVWIWHGTGDSLAVPEPITHHYMRGVLGIDTIANKVYLYVAYSPWWDSVFVMDGSTHEIIKRFNTPHIWGYDHYRQQERTVFVPTQSKFYVAGAETLLVFDTRADSFLKAIPFPRGLDPRRPMWCPETNHLLTGIYYPPLGGMRDTNIVVVVDCATDEIVDVITVGRKPRALAYNSFNKRIYVTNMVGSSVTVLRDVIGLAEGARTRQATSRVGPTIVRCILPLPGRKPAALLDITGRKVADLEPGENDIRYLSPGVYFLLQSRSGTIGRKVVIAR